MTKGGGAARSVHCSVSFQTSSVAALSGCASVHCGEELTSAEVSVARFAACEDSTALPPEPPPPPPAPPQPSPRSTEQHAIAPTSLFRMLRTPPPRATAFDAGCGPGGFRANFMHVRPILSFQWAVLLADRAGPLLPIAVRILTLERQKSRKAGHLALAMLQIRKSTDLQIHQFLRSARH